MAPIDEAIGSLKKVQEEQEKKIVEIVLGENQPTDTKLRADLASSAKGSSLVSHLATGLGAVGRPARDKLNERESVKDYAATGLGTIDDTHAITAAVANVLSSGGVLSIPSGAYNVGRTGLPGLVIDSPITAEPDADRRSVTLQGDGAGNTVIKSMTFGQYAVKLVGGVGVDSHGYEDHGNFSIVAGVSGANGLHVFNKAYTRLSNITLQGLYVGLLIESVLSSAFSNIQCRNNAIYGAFLKKGIGFSGVNANHFDSCKFSSNAVLGMHTEPHCTGLVFTNCNFENNGRHGFSSDGGCSLFFNGTEGSVGAIFNGGYFESNGGGADLFITNTGSHYVTVVLNAVVFNRNIAARFVTNCIKATGKIRLVLSGCAFSSYNGYAPSSLRKYILGDADLILTHEQCVFMDALEAPPDTSLGSGSGGIWDGGSRMTGSEILDMGTRL
ncbi:MAG: glycosyl hydrolase family 28-related protein [Burkholderiaceae bacterium]